MSKATELKVKKRKGAPEPTVAAKKTKITNDPEPPKLKSALKKTASRTIVKELPKEVSEKPAKRTRKRAEDLIEEAVEQPQVETVTKVAPEKVMKTKTTKSSDPATGESKEITKTEVKQAKKSAKSANSEKLAKIEKVIEKATASDNFEGFEDEEGQMDTIDDQTAALLAAFDSDEDENDPEDEGVSLTKLPKLPDEKSVQKQIKAAQLDEEKTPGVIYVGRIPHGFYEHQMRAYFSQFGKMSHLRLARNKKTGHAKHYAFIEFESGAVADIVAKTMDKYLMFGHILQVRRIPAEQVHAELWKGEGKRFKAMPRNKIEAGNLRRGNTREGWEKRLGREEKRRAGKKDKLAALGYEFEMPELRKVDDVPVRAEEEPAVIITAEVEDGKGDGDEATAGAIEAPKETEDVVKADSPSTKRKAETKGAKKTKKVKSQK